MRLDSYAMDTLSDNFQDLINKIHHADCFDLLAKIPDGSIDLEIFDPPYGKDYKANWKTSNNRSKKRKFSAETFEDKLDTSFLKNAYRVLKDKGAIYLFTQWDVYPIWYQAMTEAGFDVRMPIIWDKRNWGAGDLRYYGCQTEIIIFATRGNHKLNWTKREGNVWVLTKLDTINNEGNFDNPTQKPETLMRRMIEYSSKPNEIVLDCFVGSGTTARAAQTLHRKFIAGDISAYQVEIARSRICKPVNFALFPDESLA